MQRARRPPKRCGERRSDRQKPSFRALARISERANTSGFYLPLAQVPRRRWLGGRGRDARLGARLNQRCPARSRAQCPASSPGLCTHEPLPFAHRGRGGKRRAVEWALRGPWVGKKKLGGSCCKMRAWVHGQWGGLAVIGRLEAHRAVQLLSNKKDGRPRLLSQVVFRIGLCVREGMCAIAWVYVVVSSPLKRPSGNQWFTLSNKCLVASVRQ